MMGIWRIFGFKLSYCFRLGALFGLSCIGPHAVFAQRIVYDAGHYAIVTENAFVRTSASLSHQSYLEKIETSLNHINLNASSVVAAQEMIYSGLLNVNGALRNGLMLGNMYRVCDQILVYSSSMMEMGKKEPYLLLFAVDMAREVALRSGRLITEVSGFVLKQGENVLMDYNARDELMKRISDELHIISGLCYGAWRAMYWTGQRGVIRTINPFASFINADKRMVEDILLKAKYLKR
ncbi:hypothetical protein [Pedobacter frigidisoli]|uniref:hypothetical protein n=1 Tax=Pedobacter frigidisoli TaxID=2530455 RepID=UPI00292D82FF|nr:hypothetical protein [Pedobacter frigidisoli]